MCPSGWTQTNTSDIWETKEGCMLSTAALRFGFGGWFWNYSQSSEVRAARGKQGNLLPGSSQSMRPQLGQAAQRFLVGWQAAAGTETADAYKYSSRKAAWQQCHSSCGGDDRMLTGKKFFLIPKLSS